jgi:epoxyqueuosine reductase
MKYMENHFEKRLDPTLLHNGTKSVISVLYNYFSEEKQMDENAPVLSKYAYGKDYHIVVKEKLNQLIRFIDNEVGKTNSRAFVDSAPILERAWAQKAGLGWIGKNGNLLNKNLGSFFFIAEILTDLELDYENSNIKNYCGQCTRCIDACPTKAIIAPGTVDARKCISYLTIELREEIPFEFKGKMKNRVFGCDICQDVCPFNKKSKQNTEIDFKPIQELLQMTDNEWHELDNSKYQKLFENSALNRIKFEGLKKNLNFLK